MNRSKLENHRRFVIAGLCALAAAVFGAACGGGIVNPKTGGESHFLDRCDGSCGSGLDCISGVCTRTCIVGSDSCADLDAASVCTDESIEPGAVAVCDVACGDSQDCRSLGEAHSCGEGFCRGPGVAPPPSGDGGPSSNRVFACPEGNVGSDPIDVQRVVILGDTIELGVGHGGGCAEHEYSLCYGTAFAESYPVQTSLTLIHDGNGDACEAYLQTTLSFDLTPLAEAYQRMYQAGGGLVSTNYGLYAFGQLSCEDRQLGGSSQAQDAASQASRACSTKLDCMWASIDTSCSAACGALVSTTGAAELTEWLATTSERVCGDYEADGCGPVIAPPCVPPPEVDCVQGVCEEVTLPGARKFPDGQSIPNSRDSGRAGQVRLDERQRVP